MREMGCVQVMIIDGLISDEWKIMNIFIVEDSPIVQGILTVELGRIEGVTICGIAREPAEAILSIQKSKPDLVILDIVLYDGNGFEVLKKIRSEGSDVKVMILTNYSYQHYRVISREMGADLFFDKSIELEKAIQAVRELACNNNRIH
jgi:DNA-binding NarL/FixJ family response regulator